MDFEENQKRQTIRVIITEALMVLAVVVLVGVLVMIVSGYWVNQDLTIRRQGLLQVSSTPTNAAIIIDGETSLFQRTNTSKMVSTGEHVVTVVKDGYDTWTKTVKIKEGLLYRLHYPRLFLTEREAHRVLEFQDIMGTTVSPNRETLLIMHNSANWDIFDLNSDSTKKSTIDVSKAFSVVGGLKKDEILKYTWNEDSSKILFEILSNNKPAWIMLDLRNPEKSVDISKVFGLEISAVEMFDNSGDNLLIIEDGNLRKVNISSQSISRILAKNVVSFDFLENEIVYVSKKAGGVVVGNLKNIDSDAVEFLEYDDEGVWVALDRFYEDKFLTVEHEGKVVVYEWKNPSFMKEDERLEMIMEQEIGFVPTEAYCGHGGEFIIFSNQGKIATLDMESLTVINYEIETPEFGWLDDDMIYVIQDGKLIVYDYDGYNRREIANNVSIHHSVIASKNEKWLYYFSDGFLVRENLLPN